MRWGKGGAAAAGETLVLQRLLLDKALDCGAGRARRLEKPEVRIFLRVAEGSPHQGLTDLVSEGGQEELRGY